MTGVGTGGRRRILVVDDDELSRDIVKRNLQAEHEILEAESGAKALETLANEAVDLVLLDVVMPEAHGFEICRRVKASAGDAYLPVLLLTALDEQEDRNEGLAAGADDFLTKPFDRHELRLRVNTFLKLREQDRTIRSQVGKLEEMHELKDDLVALIAHDLRNPLMGIEGHLELLQKEVRAPEGPAASTRVEKLAAVTQELRQAIDGLLDVRLLEEQRLPLRIETVGIRRILRDAAGTVEGAAVARNVTIRIAVPGDPPVAVDRRLTMRAVENLLSNAVRHTGRDQAVEIRATRTGSWIRIEVADRGPGVPDELKIKLFQKFGSVAAKDTGAHGGYGLGLYLVRLVVEAHGGEVGIADRDAGGAVFSMTLPAAPDEG